MFCPSEKIVNGKGLNIKKKGLETCQKPFANKIKLTTHNINELNTKAIRPKPTILIKYPNIINEFLYCHSMNNL